MVKMARNRLFRNQNLALFENCAVNEPSVVLSAYKSLSEPKAVRRSWKPAVFVLQSISKHGSLCQSARSCRRPPLQREAWKDGGVKALAAKPHPGPSSKLLVEHKKKLVVLLTAGPLAAGYRTDLWTYRRVAEVVCKKFRVTYHADHVGHILHDLGFSPQKPQRIAREQDPVAVKQWHKKDWPRIKKRLAG